MRILVAENRSKARVALRMLLRRPGLNVVGEAINAKGLLVQTEITQPDLVILDWELRGVPKPRLLRTLHSIHPPVCVIAFNGDFKGRRAALNAGVDTFVSRAEPPERLLAAVNACWHRKFHASPRPTSGLNL